MGIVTAVRRDLEGWIEQVGETCSSVSVGEEEVVRTLREELDEAVADPRIRIVVCGEWNTGKSSLINALLGQPNLLPVNVNPCSSYITVVENVPQATYHVRRHGNDEALTHEQFLRLTAAQEGDPDIEFLRVGSPDLWPGEEVVLVDTPGLEDLDHTRAELTLGYLPSADVVVLVLAAPTGPRGTERVFVRNHLTSREIRRVIVALNKIDLLNESSDVGRIVQHTRRTLTDVLPDAPIVPVSARGSMTEWGDESEFARDGGVGTLKAEILKVVRRERIPILRKRFALPARRWLAEIFLRIQAEEAGLALTLVEAEEAVQNHRKQAAEVLARAEEQFDAARTRIRAGLRGWLDGVPERLEAMVQSLLDEVEALPDMSAVRAFVDDRVLDRRVAMEFRKICQEFEAEMMRTAQRVSEEILGNGLQAPSAPDVRVAVPEVQSVLRRLPEFVFHVAEALLLNPVVPGGIITALLTRLGLEKILKGIPILRSLLPANFLKAQLVSAVRSSLAEVPEQAERALREAADQWMKDVFTQVRAQLDRQVAAVEAGLEDARIARSREWAHVESRKAELARVGKELERIAGSLESLVS